MLKNRIGIQLSLVLCLGFAMTMILSCSREKPESNTPTFAQQTAHNMENPVQGQDSTIREKKTDAPITRDEMELVKYYVFLDYSPENPGFITTPSELKRMKKLPVTEEDKKRDREFFQKINVVTKLWVKRNLLKTATHFNLSPQKTQGIIDRAVRRGEFAKLIPSGEQEEKIMMMQRQKYPEGVDLNQLRETLETEITDLQEQLEKK